MADLDLGDSAHANGLDPLGSRHKRRRHRSERLKYRRADPPSFQWTPMLAFWSWRGVSDECSTPGVSGIVKAGGR